MIFKVHWIIDGVAEIEADNKNDAENKIQNDLEEYVKNSDKLMKAISIIRLALKEYKD